MTTTLRAYHHARDYWRISEFLINHYQPGNADGNWIEPAWEYMYFHPALDAERMDRFGIWDEDGEIVAACHYEWHLGEAFFQFHPAYHHLRVELLNYAEEHMTGISSKDGRK